MLTRYLFCLILLFINLIWAIKQSTESTGQNATLVTNNLYRSLVHERISNMKEISNQVLSQDVHYSKEKKKEMNNLWLQLETELTLGELPLSVQNNQKIESLVSLEKVMMNRIYDTTTHWFITAWEPWLEKSHFKLHTVDQLNQAFQQESERMNQLLNGYVFRFVILTNYPMHGKPY